MRQAQNRSEVTMKSKLAMSHCWRVPSVGLGLLASSLLGCSGSSSPSMSSTNPLGAAGNSSAAASGQAGASASPGTPNAGGLFDTTGDDTAVCKTALFCDNFEGFTAGSAPSGAWTATQNNGTVAVDTTRSFRGTQSVKASTVA